jgi:hypothetical protein
VHAWNTSGVRVRFRATSRRRARLRIFEEPGPSGGGNAILGWAPSSAVTERLFVRLYVPKNYKSPFVANDMAITATRARSRAR